MDGGPKVTTATIAASDAGADAAPPGCTLTTSGSGSNCTITTVCTLDSAGIVNVTTTTYTEMSGDIVSATIQSVRTATEGGAPVTCSYAATFQPIAVDGGCQVQRPRRKCPAARALYFNRREAIGVWAKPTKTRP